MGKCGNSDEQIFWRFYYEDEKESQRTWKKCLTHCDKKIDHILYTRPHPKNDGSYLYKSLVLYKGIQIETLAEFLQRQFNSDAKIKSVKEMKVLERGKDGNVTKFYLLMSYGWGMTDREAIYKVQFRQLYDGKYFYVYNTCQDDAYPITDRAIRVDQFIATLFWQVEEGTRAIEFTHLDMGGSIPFRFVNFAIILKSHEYGNEMMQAIELMQKLKIDHKDTKNDSEVYGFKDGPRHNEDVLFDQGIKNCHNSNISVKAPQEQQPKSIKPVAKKTDKSFKNASSPQQVDPNDKGRQKRLNLKCKRRRSLLKKSIELTKNFDMNMLVIMQDKDNGKFFQYASGDKDSGYFNLEKVQQEYQCLQTQGVKVKVFNDEDYPNLIATQKNDDEDSGAQDASNSKARKKNRHSGQNKEVVEFQRPADVKQTGGKAVAQEHNLEVQEVDNVQFETVQHDDDFDEEEENDHDAAISDNRDPINDQENQNYQTQLYFPSEELFNDVFLEASHHP